jgi:hypothetical protein
MKICSTCKIEKNINEFNKSKKGLKSQCKKCRKSYAQQNKDKIREQKNNIIKNIKIIY